MKQKNLEAQKARLKKVSNKEWLDAMNEVKRLIAWRLYGCKQYSGAHSEMALGLPAEDYYLGEAVGKLASGEWEWQERFTLTEQLRRIADNLISKRMEAWKRRPQEQVVVLMDLNILDEAMADMEDDDQGYDPEKLRLDTERYKIMYNESDEDEMEEMYERALAAVRGDEELTEYVKAIRICNDLDDICEGLAISKKDAYNRNKRLLRGLKSNRNKDLVA